MPINSWYCCNQGSSGEQRHRGLGQASICGLCGILETLAGAVLENVDVASESLPKLEVPLPAFHISEYHEGAAENITLVPRKLRFAADYETLVMFLSGIFEKWSEEGKLVEGNDQLRPC